MKRRPLSLVLVEGTCGAGKTTLLRATEPMFDDRDVRVLLQRTTYAPIAAREDDGTIDDRTNRSVLLEIVDGIRHELTAPRRLVLVDTLHATHFVRVGALSVESFIEIDRELHDLGALVVALRISEASVRKRAIVDRRGTGFCNYARKFGATEDDRTRYFVHEQGRLLDLLATHSRLPTLVLDGDEAREVLHQRFCRAVQSHVAE